MANSIIETQKNHDTFTSWFLISYLFLEHTLKLAKEY